jgi:hypothetical protein
LATYGHDNGELIVEFHQLRDRLRRAIDNPLAFKDCLSRTTALPGGTKPPDTQTWFDSARALPLRQFAAI